MFLSVPVEVFVPFSISPSLSALVCAVVPVMVQPHVPVFSSTLYPAPVGVLSSPLLITQTIRPLSIPVSSALLAPSPVSGSSLFTVPFLSSLAFGPLFSPVSLIQPSVFSPHPCLDLVFLGLSCPLVLH